MKFSFTRDCLLPVISSDLQPAVMGPKQPSSGVSLAAGHFGHCLTAENLANQTISLPSFYHFFSLACQLDGKLTAKPGVVTGSFPRKSRVFQYVVVAQLELSETANVTNVFLLGQNCSNGRIHKSVKP